MLYYLLRICHCNYHFSVIVCVDKYIEIFIILVMVFCVYLYYIHFIIDVLRILYILMYWCYNLDMNLYRSPFAFLETVIQAITMYSMYTMQATEWTWNKRNGLCHVQNTQHYDCKFALYLKLPVKPNLCIPFDNISNEGKSSCHFRVLFIPLHKFLPENIFEGEL